MIVAPVVASVAPAGSAPETTATPPILVTPLAASSPIAGATLARLGPSGWVGTRPGVAGDLDDLVFGSSTGAAHVLRAPRGGRPNLVTTRTRTFAWYGEYGTASGQLFSISGKGANVVEGAMATEWAFDLDGGRTLLVGTPGGKGMAESHWQVSIVDADGAHVTAKATQNESAWGAAALGDGFVVAVREPIAMSGATSGEKAAALMGVVNGNGEAAARLSEPAHGALVYVDKEGRVTRREPVGPQLPAGLAVTDHGWLVVLGTGTIRWGFRDAVVSVRGPNEGSFRQLASGVDTPTGLWQRGGWVCLTEMPSKDRGETRVLHCLDPERGLRVATTPIEGIVTFTDIELGRPSRVWLARHRYGTPGDDVLTVALP